MTLGEWLQYFLYTCGAWLIQRAIATLYLAVKRRVDDAIPDHLDVGAGAWVRGVIAERNLGVKVLVEPSKNEDVDAFFPSARVVRLSQQTFFKKDPSFWAVAAHELGHAIVWGKSKLIGIPLATARFWGQTLLGIGGGLILANILYAIDGVSTFAIRAYEIGAALFLFTLADEAAASIVGMRILRADPRIDARGMWGARFRLIAAYLTYVGAFIGQLLFLSREKWITTMIATHRHFVAAPPTHHTIVITLLSVLVVLASLFQIGRIVRRPHLTKVEDISKHKTRDLVLWIVADIACVVLVWLVWDQPFRTHFQVSCIVGLYASRLGLVTLLVPAFIIVGLLVTIVAGIVAKFRKRPEEKKETSPEPSLEEMKQMMEEYERMYIEAHNHPSWHETVVKLASALGRLYFIGALVRELF